MEDIRAFLHKKRKRNTSLESQPKKRKKPAPPSKGTKFKSEDALWDARDRQMARALDEGKKTTTSTPDVDEVIDVDEYDENVDSLTLGFLEDDDGDKCEPLARPVLPECEGDEALARRLEALEFQDENKNTGTLSDPIKEISFPSFPPSSSSSSLELIESHPNVHELFRHYDEWLFEGRLKAVSVSWSSKMTSCAGLCQYLGGNACSIRLSEPLLQYRDATDLRQTLLHEMIHAYLFVILGLNNRSAHGTDFCCHMRRVNEATGLNITIYHTFLDEVRHHQKHKWVCTGPCERIICRAMNRPPGPKDLYFDWAGHQSICGGKFIKFDEPEGYRSKSGKSRRALCDQTSSKNQARSKEEDKSKKEHGRGGRKKA